MSTARDLITRSMRLAHILDSGEDPTADEANDALTALNDLLDFMSVPGLFTYATKENIVTWTGGSQSQTIGSGGDFNVTRPTRIEDSTYFRSSAGDDYLIKVLRSKAAYSAIIAKDTQSNLPEYLYYEPSNPLGVLYIWPVPSSSLSVYLHSQEQLSQASTLNSTISFPPGYKELLTAELAARLCPEFGVAMPPELMDMRRRANIAVKRMNKKTVYSALELPGTGRTYSIYSDI